MENLLIKYLNNLYSILLNKKLNKWRTGSVFKFLGFPYICKLVSQHILDDPGELIYVNHINSNPKSKTP